VLLHLIAHACWRHFPCSLGIWSASSVSCCFISNSGRTLTGRHSGFILNTCRGCCDYLPNFPTLKTLHSVSTDVHCRGTSHRQLLCGNHCRSCARRCHRPLLLRQRCFPSGTRYSATCLLRILGTGVGTPNAYGCARMARTRRLPPCRLTRRRAAAGLLGRRGYRGTRCRRTARCLPGAALAWNPLAFRGGRRLALYGPPNARGDLSFACRFRRIFSRTYSDKLQVSCSAAHYAAAHLTSELALRTRCLLRCAADALPLFACGERLTFFSAGYAGAPHSCRHTVIQPVLWLV